MIASPAGAVQRAIFAVLSNSTEVIAAFGGAGPRIYDQVPTSPNFPYVVIGDDQVSDDSHAETAFEVHATVHVFARDKGVTQAKEIGDAIFAALGSGDITLVGFVSKTAEIESALTNSTYFYEPDRLTAHGVLVFRYLLDQA